MDGKQEMKMSESTAKQYVRDLVYTTRHAWRDADAAISATCSELAAVPGAAEQWHELCNLSREYQINARSILDAAASAASNLTEDDCSDYIERRFK